MAMPGEDWAAALLEASSGSGGWIPVGAGESGDRVFRRDDGRLYAKLAPLPRLADLAGERDRLAWLAGKGIACPEIAGWREHEDGACLLTSALAGVPAADFTGPDLLAAWPSIAATLAALHGLPAGECPFDRGLAGMIARARDVVALDTVNPDFLPDADRNRPASELLARVTADLPLRLAQEEKDRVVCHGDPCMPNFLVDPVTLRCTGFIDLGRLGTANRHADLALTVANAAENWTAPAEAERAAAILEDVLRIRLDPERLAFYLRLDPLTWG